MSRARAPPGNFQTCGKEPKNEEENSVRRARRREGAGHARVERRGVRQKETFVAFCGMVGLRAKVLGQLGRTSSPHPRACALSCPSSAIYGPGSLGHLTRPFFMPLFTGARGREILRS